MSKWARRHLELIWSGTIGAALACMVLAVCTIWIWRERQTVETARRNAETTLYRVGTDVINEGSHLYNTGDPATCCKLYRLALRAFKPLLSHQPDLQEAIDHALADVDPLPAAEAQAFALRATLDKIRAAVKPK